MTAYEAEHPAPPTDTPRRPIVGALVAAFVSLLVVTALLVGGGWLCDPGWRR